MLNLLYPLVLVKILLFGLYLTIYLFYYNSISSHLKSAKPQKTLKHIPFHESGPSVGSVSQSFQRLVGSTTALLQLSGLPSPSVVALAPPGAARSARRAAGGAPPWTCDKRSKQPTGSGGATHGVDASTPTSGESWPRERSMKALLSKSLLETC